MNAEGSHDSPATDLFERQITALLKEIPLLEEQARALQASESETADPAAVQRLRSAYSSWYSKSLVIVPDHLQAKFRDFYEGGNFVHRIRHFLEAPTEANSLLSVDPTARRSPFISYWANPFGTTFGPSLVGQQQLLYEALETHRSSVGPQAATTVEAICRRFPMVIRSMRHRRENRAAIEVNDEYDVQDVMRLLLTALFDDVRPEEWTPSYAGGSSRMDFLLKREGVVVETKMTHDRIAAREVRDQLAVDLLRYQAHPDCHILVCFVFDPQGLIMNPRGVEQDLTKAQGNLVVRVVVAQG